MDYLQLTGRKNSELVLWDQFNNILIHKSMRQSLEELRAAALMEGIDIGVVSGFRDYDRQLSIWNAKASGKRKLLDRRESAIDHDVSTQEEILEAILSWSAIPGASRHHWGSEIDIFDKKIKPKKEVQLTVQECEEDFSKLYLWLEENITRFSFHRPYEEDLGGVAKEPWHLSYSPLSLSCEKAYSVEVFERNVSESDMLLKDLVLKDLERIYSKYVMNVKST